MLDQIFISDALANTAQGAASKDLSLVMLIAIVAIFYFFIVRPQSKKMKEHDNMIKSLKVGNKIVINSGIIGVIESMDNEDHIEVEISDGVHVNILRDHVARVIDAGNNKKSAAKKKPAKKAAKAKKKS